LPRFKLVIEYAGTRYSGWQIQKNARTVQGEIDRAVREISGRREFELYGAGRTDAGVHAVENAPHRFHARHDAVSRRYLYQIARRRTAFGKPFVWWIREPLDLDAMRAAAAAFVGRQDFAAYSDDDPEEKSTVVAVDRVQIVEAAALVLVRVQGSHFLWKMVRRMVGVLAAVGRGELKPSDAGDLLDPASAVSRTTTAAALAAPAAGLFLERVYYKGDRRDDELRPVIGID
jgi:tRNA pseudouridine38-40 synthase